MISFWDKVRIARSDTIEDRSRVREQRKLRWFYSKRDHSAEGLGFEAKESSLCLYRFDHAAHRQTLISFPPFGELVNFLPQIDISDVTCLDDEIIGRRKDR